MVGLFLPAPKTKLNNALSSFITQSLWDYDIGIYIAQFTVRTFELGRNKSSTKYKSIQKVPTFKIRVKYNKNNILLSVQILGL